jgi:hypothetical protein
VVQLLIGRLEALNSFLMGFRRVFSTPLQTAGLLLKNLLPNGHDANFGLVLVQRLGKACLHLKRCFREKDNKVVCLDAIQENHHFKKQLEPDWKDVPVEHITGEAVNEWAWKKRDQGLSWSMIKNIL